MRPGAQTSALQARFLLRDLVQRAGTTTLSCPVELNGTAKTPSAGTFELFDAAGQLVTSGAVTVVDGVATYTVGASVVPATLPLGDGWQSRWALTIDGEVHTIVNAAALVRLVLYNPCTDADLYRKVRALDPTDDATISSVSTYAEQLHEAFVHVQGRIDDAGRRAYLVRSPSQLREVVRLFALADIFEDFAARQGDTYAERARDYREQAERAFGRMRLDYDENDDGFADTRGKPAVSAWFMG